MSLLRHLLIALIYAAVAVAVALTLPYSVEGIGRWTAVALGALVLVFGALIHEVYARSQRERALNETLALTAAERTRLQHQLTHAREELRAIRDRVVDRPDGDAVIRAAAAETALAERLVRRLDPPDEAAQPMVAPETESRVRALLARPLRPDRPDTGGASTRPVPDDGPPRPAAPAGTDPGGRREPTFTALPPEPAPTAATHADAGAIIAAVREALRHDRLQVVFRPIVTLPQRQTVHLDCFSRVPVDKDAFILPGEHSDIVADAGFSTTIDNLVLFRCIQMIRSTLRSRRQVGFFARVSPLTLRDPVFLEDFVGFIEDTPTVAPRLILVVDLDDLVELLGPLRPIIDRLSGLGTRFAIDRVGNLTRIDTDLFIRGHIRFIKAAAQTALAQARDPFSSLDMPAVKEQLTRAATDLIVDGVADEPMLLEVLELGVDYGAGPLFGAPKAL